MSLPDKINRMMTLFPEIKFITAHFGGMRYMNAIRAVSTVDISCKIVDLVEPYGTKITNNILKKFGLDRLYLELTSQDGTTKKLTGKLEYGG